MMEDFLTFIFFYFLFCLTIFVLWLGMYRVINPEDDILIEDLVGNFWHFLVPFMNILFLIMISVEAIKYISDRKGWGKKVVLKGKVPKR